MEELGQHGKDRDSSASISTLPLHTGDGYLPDNRIDKPTLPKDERIVSPNLFANAAVAGSVRYSSNQSGARSASRSQTPVNSTNTYGGLEQTYYCGGET